MGDKYDSNYKPILVNPSYSMDMYDNFPYKRNIKKCTDSKRGLVSGNLYKYYNSKHND